MRVLATAAPLQPVVQSVTRLLVSYGLCLALLGCASLQPPLEIDETPLRERAETQTVGSVQVNAAVLSAEDSQNFFGADLSANGVQAVWLEIVNHSSHSLRLLRSGTDPDYFSPLEVAWSYHGALSGDANRKIDEHFRYASIDGVIPPGETRSGFLYVNPHHRTQVINIDLLGQKTNFPFTLFLQVPGEQDDHNFDGIWDQMLRAQGNEYQDELAFRQALEQLPASTSVAQGAAESGPLNVVLIGKLADIAAALIRREYRHAPTPADAAQQVFGRPPDFVSRKAGQGGVTANWMRIWVAPLYYQGQTVFVGQAGRPVGGRFMATDDAAPRLHPDVDEARAYVIQDLLYSGGLAKLGFVGGVNAVSAEQHRNQPEELNYHSDGLRAVLFFVTRPLSLADAEILDWVPALEVQAAEAAKRNAHQNAD